MSGRNGKPQSRPRVTGRSRATFLRELAGSCNVAAAAARAGHHRATWYRLREADPEFAKRWAEALAEAVDRLEAEAFRIAMEGVSERIYNAAGELISTRTREDPRLIEALLRAHRPAVYSERRRLELSGHLDGAGVMVEVDPTATLEKLAEAFRASGLNAQAAALDVLAHGRDEALERFGEQMRRMAEREQPRLELPPAPEGQEE